MTVLEELNEGIASIEQAGVRIERLRHSLNVMEQQLDTLEAMENNRSGLWATLFRRNK